jgi:hypothetical protein
VAVAEKEVRGIDQYAVVAFRRYREAPEDGRCERVLTERRSSGLTLDERKDSFACTRKTL